MKQKIIVTKTPFTVIQDIADRHHCSRWMLVCDSAFAMLATYEEYSKSKNIAVKFQGFSPNPLYEEVCEGVRLFQEKQCDGILAIGGGSAIDTAKCIRAFSKMAKDTLYLSQEFSETGIPLVAVPTTAGTGSESTKYAVVYYRGEKQSVTHDTLIPDYALLDARNLETLPLYQKKCTMLDALCQAIESWWSVNATAESQKISQKAVAMIMNALHGYLSGDQASAEKMLQASNLAGQAINITQTTAAHAMSYKLTSLYKIPHGRAAFVCLPYVWEYMLTQTSQDAPLFTIFHDIAVALHCKTPFDAVAFLKALNQKLFHKNCVAVRMADIPLLAASVNPTRLKNNPVKLDEDVLTDMYTRILETLNLFVKD